MDCSETFSGKKITLMGLGLLGRGVGDAKFLAECGADLVITDLKKEEELKSSLKKLQKYKNIKYTLGRHDFKDFEGRDMILKAANVPLESAYIAHARTRKIPIEMDESLFAKISNANIVGVTGTRGKTTTTTLVYEILKSAEGDFSGLFGFKIGKVYLAGNIKGVATLPFLKKVKPNDIFVLELSSWQLQGFDESKISPRVAIFTNFMDDHLNYYKGDVKRYWMDKAAIFKNQKDGDIFVCSKEVVGIAKSMEDDKFMLNVTISGPFPKNFKTKLIGQHNLDNISLAIVAAKKIGINVQKIKKVVSKFSGVPGRLEFIRKWKGISFYNDTTATTPDAAIAAVRSF
ncbi:MAG: UDP-N-acetylmuramoyl-L-alanine--D-glutamate ligase, partial [Candidatus Paceibacterota bacterium]